MTTEIQRRRNHGLSRLAFVFLAILMLPACSNAEESDTGRKAATDPIQLAQAEPAQLTTRAYNIRGFSSKASDIRSEVLKHYPDANIVFEPDPARQALVDSWPEDVDDTLAQKDWGFSPKHGLLQALSDYLVPAMKKRYGAIAES